MKIIFFTKSKQYTCKLLVELLGRGHEMAIVVKSFDIFIGTEMDLICRENGIAVFCHNDLLKPSFCQENSFELGISFNYGRKISSDIIKLLNGRIINLHGAPLPHYKGAFPYNFGLYNLEKEWGVTAHYVTDDIDGGAIIEIVRFSMDPYVMTISQLVDICQKKSFELSLRIIGEFEKGRIPEGTIQSERGHYYSRDDFENLKRVDVINESGEEIQRRIRACYCPPYEGAYFEKDGYKFSLSNGDV